MWGILYIYRSIEQYCNKLTYANDNSRFYEDIESYLKKSDFPDKIEYIFFDLNPAELKTTFVSQVYKVLSRESEIKVKYSRL